MVGLVELGPFDLAFDGDVDVGGDAEGRGVECGLSWWCCCGFMRLFLALFFAVAFAHLERRLRFPECDFVLALVQRGMMMMCLHR